MQNRTYDKERVSFTLARLKKGGENFEVVISDIDKALSFRSGNEIKITEFVQSQTIFENANKGLKASEKLRLKKYDPVLKKHVWFVEKKMPPHSK